MTKLHDLIKEKNNIETKIEKEFEKLPRYDEDCNCDCELGVYDLDVDFDEGTATIVCINCGGYIYQ